MNEELINNLMNKYKERTYKDRDLSYRYFEKYEVKVNVLMKVQRLSKAKHSFLLFI